MTRSKESEPAFSGMGFQALAKTCPFPILFGSIQRAEMTQWGCLNAQPSEHAQLDGSLEFCRNLRYRRCQFQSGSFSGLDSKQKPC